MPSTDHPEIVLQGALLDPELRYPMVCSEVHRMPIQKLPEKSEAPTSA